MKFYIDTNIFYEYFGRENIGDSINKNINHNRLYRMLHSSNNEVYISSASITEIIVKFMDSPETLKSILKFILEDDIIIKNHAIMPFDFDDLFEFVIAQKTDLFYLNKVLEAKIETESSVGIALCGFLLQVYLDFYLSREELRNNEYAVIPDSEKQRLNAFIQNSVLNDRIDRMFHTEAKIASKKLRKGYRTNTSKCSALKESKKVYNNFIIKNLITTSVFAENMIKNYLGQPYHFEIEDAILSNEDANKMLKSSDHVAKSVSNIIKKYRSEFSIDFIEEGKTGYLKQWDLDVLQNKLQHEYAMFLVTNWLNKGVKAEKNDVLDFLVIGGLDDEIFLTLDTNIVQFLKTKKHISLEYIERITN